MHQSIGIMVVGAGVVPVLLEFVKNRKREHLNMVASNKAVVLLDGFLYGYSNAFTAYVAAGGLNVFIERIKVRFPFLLPLLVLLTRRRGLMAVMGCAV
jgi:E3 ubiquitin-protein ligase HUWE1